MQKFRHLCTQTYCQEQNQCDIWIHILCFQYLLQLYKPMLFCQHDQHQAFHIAMVCRSLW